MNNGSQPIGNGNPHGGGGVVAYLAELLRLSPAQLIATSVLLQKRLGSTDVAGSDEYRVPADRDFVVFQIHSSFRPTDMLSEVAATLITDVEQLFLARLSNVLVGLQNKDRNLKIFDARDIPMSAAYKTPLYFPAMAPLLVPSTHTLKADFTLQDTSVGMRGEDADYGLMLTGVLIPKRI